MTNPLRKHGILTEREQIAELEQMIAGDRMAAQVIKSKRATRWYETEEARLEDQILKLQAQLAALRAEREHADELIAQHTAAAKRRSGDLKVLQNRKRIEQLLALQAKIAAEVQS